MTLTEARAQLDILIDKVDQAYFTVLEKNTFLNKAGVEYFDKYYNAMGANQLLRDKLGYFIKNIFIRGKAGVAPYDDNPTRQTYGSVEDYLHLLSGTVNGKVAKVVSWEDFQYLSGDNGTVAPSEDPYNRADYDHPIMTIGPTLAPTDPSIDFNPNGIYYYPHNEAVITGARRATLSYVLDSSTGEILQVNITDPGAGYASPSTIPVSIGFASGTTPLTTGGGLGAASITVNTIGGQVVNVNIINGGANYGSNLLLQLPDPTSLTTVTSSDSLTISYVREPISRKITNEFAQLNSSMAHEIVQIAARMMSAAIESSNYEVQNNESNL